MGCGGCAGRARKAMLDAGYTLKGTVWYDIEGEPVIRDALVEEEHLKLLPLAVQQVVLKARKEIHDRLEKARGYLFG